MAQLNNHHGVIVDDLGNVLYVADHYNHRIMCRSKEGRIIVGENGAGQKRNQFSGVYDLSFDQQGNLYVVDRDNY